VFDNRRVGGYAAAKLVKDCNGYGGNTSAVAKVQKINEVRLLQKYFAICRFRSPPFDVTVEAENGRQNPVHWAS
jgi:hypothetical protein